MKGKLFLITFLAIASVISGVLTSGISFVGRLGVNVFYKQYKFFKTWWQGALVFFAAMLLVYIICWSISRYAKRLKTVCLLVLTAVFIAGLYFTYKDFRGDLSHRWLGEKFHLGIYLYWVGAIAISLFFLVRIQQNKVLKGNIQNVK